MRHLFKPHQSIQSDATARHGVHRDEPVLLLTSSMPNAAQVVRTLAAYSYRDGADPVFVRALHFWADEMDRHRAEHGERQLRLFDESALDVPYDVLHPPT